MANEQNEAGLTSTQQARYEAVCASAEALRSDHRAAKAPEIVELAEYIVGGDPYMVKLYRDMKVERDLSAPIQGDGSNDFLDALRNSAPDGVMVFSEQDLRDGTVEETLRNLFNN